MSRPRKNPEFITKICEGCKKEFVVSSRKYRQRFCNKSCAQNTSSVQEKMKKSQLETYRRKYGVDHPMRTEKTKNNFKKTMLEKYGVEHALENVKFLNKAKKTKLAKYGDENYNNYEQSKQTCLEKYGVENYVYANDYKQKLEKTCLKKYGVIHPSMSENYKQSHYDNMFEKFTIDERFKNFTPMFSKEQYQGLTHGIKKYKFKCNRCNNIDLHNIGGGFSPICINCDKLNSSKEQKEIYDFLKEILGNEEVILMNEKSILYPKEIDIYLPSYNLAIEYNSLYWHSEVSGKKNKVYHINKTKQCISKGIKLIHIFQTDWKYKTDIVKSILKNVLQKTKNKINGRDCIVKEITKLESDSFLNSNHIQGSDNSSIRIGLFHENILISVMTFGKSRYDTKLEYEMYRYCNKINFNVTGGASKLFSYFIKTHNPSSIVSYSDRKYFDGNLYLKLGFVFVKNTSPNYYYISDNYSCIKNRMAFQKHKLPNLLENFNPFLTEWENMKLNGFDRIWDCGNGKWIWKNKTT